MSATIRSTDGAAIGTPAPAVLPAVMQAVRADRYGDPAEVLGVRTVDRPVAGKGEVLVRMEVAGLSRGALHLTTGTPYLLRLAGFGFRAPKHAMGNELAGTVVEVGDGVTRFAVGDEVFGYAMGTCAEFAVAKADKLAHRPDGVTARQAAAIVDSASTALQAVRDHAEVQRGQRVLVLGASGGVGSFAVQVAKASGATVTGTARTEKVGFVRDLGADEVVDHARADPLAAAEPFDVIIDLGGNRAPKAMLAALAPDGTLVIVGGEGGGKLTGGFERQLLAPIRAVGGSQRVKTFTATEHHRYLDELAAMVASGQIIPAIDQVHALAEAAVGLERMEAGAIRGKDLVEVRTEP
jgi:NADPH:quinone reductase-like Zn-dependent oxidoreductase